MRTKIRQVKGRQTGGFQTGGFPDLDLSFLFCPSLTTHTPLIKGVWGVRVLGLSRFFWDLGMVRGFSRFVLFLFLGLLRAPTRNSPGRARDTIWTFPEKRGKPPGLETPRLSFSQARKRHININFFARLVLGRPQVCPGISLGLSLGQIR